MEYQLFIHQSQELQFQPTHLYIKRHTITGKCYFGKTIQKEYEIKYGVKRARELIKIVKELELDD